MRNTANYLTFVLLRTLINPPFYFPLLNSLQCNASHKKKIYCTLFLFPPPSSALPGPMGPTSPSSTPSAVGFNKLCTLLAMLLRRVGGALPSTPLKVNRAPGSCQPGSVPAPGASAVVEPYAPPVAAAGGGRGGVICRLLPWVARGSS
jgi:hypothetical protein